MRLLIDTHAFLWFITDSDKLSPTARDLRGDTENDRIMSVASLREIAIKNSLGKLELKKPFDSFIPQQLEHNKVDLLAIEITHLAKLVTLPFNHHDPFDRLIIAQAVCENLPVLSVDTRFDSYEIQRLW